MGRRFLWLRLVAVSLVTAYGLWSAKELHDFYELARRSSGMPPDRPLRRLVLVTVPLFVWWSLLVLALSALPRGGRRSWRRPGIVPGVAVVLFTGREVIEAVVQRVRYKGIVPIAIPWSIRLAIPSPADLVTVSHSAGFAVAATWLALWVGGWWRPAPTWTDRAGRTLGWYWVVVCVVDPFYFSLL